MGMLLIKGLLCGMFVVVGGPRVCSTTADWIGKLV